MSKLKGKRICSNLTPLLNDKTGRIHSVFSSALNINIGGKLVTVLALGSDIYPFSIVLENKLDFSVFSVGDLVTADKNEVVITSKEGEYSIDLASCQEVNLDYKQNSAHVVLKQDYNAELEQLAYTVNRLEMAEESLAALTFMLGEKHCKKHRFNIWCEFLAPRFKALEKLIKNGDTCGIYHYGKNVAGCGPGLTPASDDFISGLISAVYALKGDRRLSDSLAQGTAPHTNTISREMLTNSAMGFFSENYIDFVNSFMLGEQHETSPKVAKLAEHGSTSGIDTLTGFWFGLRTLSSAGEILVGEIS